MKTDEEYVERLEKIIDKQDALLYLTVEFIISHLRLSPSYPIAPPRLYSAILLMKSALII